MKWDTFIDAFYFINSIGICALLRSNGFDVHILSIMKINVLFRTNAKFFGAEEKG